VSTEWIVLVYYIKYVVYYNKRFYAQLIRSTTRRYFRGRQKGPAWKCIYQ